MWLRVWIIGLLGLAAVAGCGERDDALQGRVQALEQRLAGLEQRLTSVDKDLPTGERLRNDLRAVEQRLGAVEAKATEALETAKAAPPPTSPAAAAASRGGRESVAGPARPDPAVRRAQLGGLMTEYRHRLDDLKKQQGPEATPAERIAGRREVREWYIARRRAILAGQPLPD